MSRITLTPSGVSLLEEHLVREFIDNPDEMTQAMEVLKLDLTPQIRKYLRDYFDILEDLTLIRCGEEPKHHFREFYGLR